MAVKRISVGIDRVTLRGFSQDQAAPFRRGLEERLAHLCGQSDTASQVVAKKRQHVSEETRSPPGATPEQIGQLVAGALFRKLK